MAISLFGQSRKVFALSPRIRNNSIIKFSKNLSLSQYDSFSFQFLQKSFHPISSYSSSKLLKESVSSSQNTSPNFPNIVGVFSNTEPPTSQPDKASIEPVVLEVKDGKVIFDTVWQKLEKKYGRERLQFPREIIWLMGAPGSGKSYNAPWIRKAREIPAAEIVMSSLLTGPEAESSKNKAELVSDSFVIGLLLEKLLEPKYASGVVVDGFPRTKVQVESIKLLQQKMLDIYKEFKDTPTAELFKRPVFRVAVLYVDEYESIQRQIKRGKEAREHNLRVEQTGRGKKVEERVTDFDEEKARQRYRVFKEHYSTLQELQKLYPFSIINTMAPPEVVKQEIQKEFIYQSSLELSEGTFKLVSKLPLASEIVKQSRQKLISRLDSYHNSYSELFQVVIQKLQETFIPRIAECTLSGVTIIKTVDAFYDNPLVVNMITDIFSERGFTVTSEVLSETIPVHFDKNNGTITNSIKNTRQFKIHYKKAILRQNFDLD